MRATRRQVTLGEYVRRRNGVPAGSRGALRNMFHRSFGAGSFAGFWRYWNPVFGYVLGRYVFSPLRKALPSALALVATFVVSGVVHDLVSTAVRGSVAFLFTPWFFFHGVGVVLGEATGMDLSRYPWLLRASVNFTYVLVCLALALIVKSGLQ